MKIRPDPDDEPFLPSVGQLFWVKTWLFLPPDKHDERPVLVVNVPLNTRGRISVVTRTSDTRADGVQHRADRTLGLGQDGVFSRLSSTEAQNWTPRNVRFCGTVGDAVLRAVIARWYA